MASETSSAITEPDADGYRADCTGVTFNQVRYVNLETNEVACFTRNSGSVTLGSNWKFNDAEAWTSNTAGVASTDYSYQLNVPQLIFHGTQAVQGTRLVEKKL